MMCLTRLATVARVRLSSTPICAFVSPRTINVAICHCRVVIASTSYQPNALRRSATGTHVHICVVIKLSLVGPAYTSRVDTSDVDRAGQVGQLLRRVQRASTAAQS